MSGLPDGDETRRRPRRVVSLVPSLTEAIETTAPGTLVGATDYCTHPEHLDVPRVGGTKYPKLERVFALQPDLVIANAEENRPEDVERLRAAGIQVWVSAPGTVGEAITTLRTMLCDVLGLAERGLTERGLTEPDWLAKAAVLWAEPVPEWATAIVPVWRKPWVVVGRDTFASDVLRQLGVRNLYADHRDRYPRPSLAELQECGADLVVLPDEPYRFTADDGPQFFPDARPALVNGRYLTWYGPSLATGRDELVAALRAG